MPEASPDFTNLYATLGVPEDSSIELITASYKALAKAFHPDIFKGDKGFADKRLKDINYAFSILVNPTTRESYDTELQACRIQRNSRRTSNDQSFDTQWSRACDFFPELFIFESHLKNLSPELSDTFRSIIIESKAFSDAGRLKDHLIEEFSEQRFGKDTVLQKVGLKSLELGYRTFAFKINQACFLLGEENRDRILAQLSKEYPSDATNIYRECGLNMFPPAEVATLRPGIYKAGGRISFRVLPNLSVNVFEEDGVYLLTYKRFSEVDKMLDHYSLRWGSIKE